MTSTSSKGYHLVYYHLNKKIINFIQGKTQHIIKSKCN